jgi:hypothetical protein
MASAAARIARNGEPEVVGCRRLSAVMALLRRGTNGPTVASALAQSHPKSPPDLCLQGEYGRGELISETNVYDAIDQPR